MAFIITIKYWMLKWRGVWEGFGVFDEESNYVTFNKRRKLYPRAGIASSRIPALGKRG